MAQKSGSSLAHWNAMLRAWARKSQTEDLSVKVNTEHLTSGAPHCFFRFWLKWPGVQLKLSRERILWWTMFLKIAVTILSIPQASLQRPLSCPPPCHRASRFLFWSTKCGSNDPKNVISEPGPGPWENCSSAFTAWNACSWNPVAKYETRISQVKSKPHGQGEVLPPSHAHQGATRVSEATSDVPPTVALYCTLKRQTSYGHTELLSSALPEF